MRNGAFRTAGLIAGIIYAYGAVLCVIGLVDALVFDRQLPSYEWLVLVAILVGWPIYHLSRQ